MSNVQKPIQSIEAQGKRMSDVQLGMLLADLQLRAELVLR